MMRLVCWGTRGSVPTPGPATVRYGGNTPCIELRPPGGRCLILDAGTGMVPLGRQLSRGTPCSIDVFLTHMHWDHIQGLPFFMPLYDAAWTVRIHSGAPAGSDEFLALQLRDPFFPVALSELRARLTLHEVGERWIDDDVVVRSIPVRHPGRTFGFRVDAAGVSVVYIPDNELAGSGYAVASTWERDIVEFVRGADLLVHDAMFTTNEYSARRGWGHGTFEQAVQLAEAADVARLLLFHHAPERDDAQLDGIVTELQQRTSARPGGVQVEAAVEGREVLLLPLRPEA